MSDVRSSILACSVRGCGRSLERAGGALVCGAGHSFDVARSGYVNLLQPQDRRSRTAGDSPEAVAARARLLSAGVARALIEGVVRAAVALELRAGAAVVELGSGTGELLAALAGALPIDGTGIDLSSAAAEHAARRFRQLSWVVANADRRLPLLDASVDLLLSIHGRRNPGEFARVLRPDGFLLVGVSAADDLIELRAAVLGRGEERDRTASLLAELEPGFSLERRATVRERRTLARAELLDCLRSTYRGGRKSAREGVSALGSLAVTFSSELLLFRPR